MMNPHDSNESNTLYRSRRGWLLGVCQGIAEYRDIPSLWVRLLVLAVFFLTGLYPTLFLYILAALVMKPEPVVPIKSDGEEEFYNSYVDNRSMALRRLKRMFGKLDQRIQRMESFVTSSEFDWDTKIGS